MFNTSDKFSPWLTTQAELAALCNVSRRTIIDWCNRDGFPSKTKRGWERDAILRWCEDEKRGPFKEKAEAGKDYAKQRLAYLVERTERQRITKEKEQIALALRRGELILASDVIAKDRRVAGTGSTALDTVFDQQDRDWPVDVPSAKDWAKVRKRNLENLRVALDAVRVTIQEAITDE